MHRNQVVHKDYLQPQPIPRILLPLYYFLSCHHPCTNSSSPSPYPRNSPPKPTTNPNTGPSSPPATSLASCRGIFVSLISK